jgi:hypothetical protein
MKYYDPKKVQGPRKHVANVKVVYDGGERDAAVAELEWDGERSVGIRWNGSSEERPLGHPQSRGNPVWFQVPPQFADAVLDRARELAPESPLAAAYREMAADGEREREAAEWAERLMNDAQNATG